MKRLTIFLTIVGAWGFSVATSANASDLSHRRPSHGDASYGYASHVYSGHEVYAPHGGYGRNVVAHGYYGHGGGLLFASPHGAGGYVVNERGYARGGYRGHGNGGSYGHASRLGVSIDTPHFGFRIGH